MLNSRLPRDGHGRTRWKLAAGAALCAVGVVTYNASVDKASENIAAAQVASCERGNVVVAVGIVDAGQNARQPVVRQANLMRIYSIRDCPRTTADGKATSLSKPDAKRFIDKVARQMGVYDWNKQQ